MIFPLLVFAGCNRESGDDTGTDGSTEPDPVDTGEPRTVGRPCRDHPQDEPCAGELAAASASEPGQADWGGQKLIVHDSFVYVGAPGIGSADRGNGTSHLSVFRLPDLEWVGRWMGTSDTDGTGSAFAIADPDSNGVSDIAIGRFFASDGPDQTRGAVYLVVGQPYGDLSLKDSAEASFYSPPYVYVGTNVAFADLDGSGAPEIIASGPGSSHSEEWTGAVYAIDPALRGEHTADAALRSLVGSPGTGSEMTVWDGDADGQADLVTTVPDGVALFRGPWLADLTQDDFDVAWAESYPHTFGYDGLETLGDVTGDGAADLAASSLGLPVEPERAGRVTLIEGGVLSGGPAEELPFRVDGQQIGEAVGLGQAVRSGDVDGDGIADLIVGASGVYPGSLPGQVLVFGGPLAPSTLTPDDAIARVHGEYDGDYFGRALDVADVDGDGRTDVVVGAQGWPRGYSDGKVYLLLATDLLP